MMLNRTIKHFTVYLLLILMMLPSFAVGAGAEDAAPLPILECYELNIHSVFRETDNIEDALKDAKYTDSYQFITNEDGHISYLRLSDGKTLNDLYDIMRSTRDFFTSDKLVELVSDYTGKDVTVYKTYHLTNTAEYSEYHYVLYYETCAGDFIYCVKERYLFPASHFTQHLQTMATVPRKYINSYLDYYCIDSELFNMAAKPDQEYPVDQNAYIVLVALLAIGIVITVFALIHKKRAKDLDLDYTAV